MIPRKFYFGIVALTTITLTRCQQPQTTASEEHAHLGALEFSVTGTAAAQPKFEEGMLLLHSFEYTDAREAFEEAIAIDSGFVMAYWGEAMSLNHALWREQDMDKGIEVLNRIDTTAEGRVAKAQTDLEKDFIRAVNILYGEGDKATRDSNYCMFMKSLYQKYPGNDEVATFYSLSLIGWGTTDKDKKHFEKAAEIAIEVLERNPKHPGALHYTIHAYDDPEYAEMALAIADKYAGVAPDAGHALHMPTHTYLALGKWEQVVSSNIESWEAEKARKERKGLDNNSLGYHAYHWLLYGRLQLGDFETARLMVDSMQSYCEELPSPQARAHMVLFKTTYLASTGDYGSGVEDIKVDVSDLNIVTRSKDYYTSGMAAYHRNDRDALDSITLKLAKERTIEKLKISGSGVRLCGNVNRSAPTETDLLEAEAMELQLRAMRAWMDKDATKTEELLVKATELHTEAGYSYGPPAIVKPSFEMYGEWLLENNRPKEAMAQFERSLELAPNKTLSVEGKQAAQKLI